MIVDAQTLHAHLHDSSWLVLDCRHALADFDLGRRLYESAHIPGARFANVETDLSGVKTGTNGRHPLPDRDTFVEFLRTSGATDTTQIVAYDAGGDMFAARLWTLCRWIGHEAVAVLDGGMAAWNDAGFPTTDAPAPVRQRGTITANAPLDPVLNVAATLPRVGAGALLLDARAPERYAGITEPIDPVAGHIPGAINRPFKENFDERGRFKTPGHLRAEFARIGIDASTAGRSVSYCGSGISAAVNLLASLYAGLGGGALYAGGWSEWCADPSRPVERSATT